MLGGVRYNRTIEKVTVLTTLCSSHAAACVIMSAMSSCAALGNIVICWMNGSVHAAFRSTYQSPACHSGAAANMRAIFPPCGLIPITPGTFSFSRWTTAGPFALSSTITAQIGTMHFPLPPDLCFGRDRVEVFVDYVQNDISFGP